MLDISSMKLMDNVVSCRCDIVKLTGLLDGMKEKQAKASDELVCFQFHNIKLVYVLILIF